jgi:hypothetical protein
MRVRVKEMYKYAFIKEFRDVIHEIDESEYMSSKQYLTITSSKFRGIGIDRNEIEVVHYEFIDDIKRILEL